MNKSGKSVVLIGIIAAAIGTLAMAVFRYWQLHYRRLIMSDIK